MVGGVDYTGKRSSRRERRWYEYTGEFPFPAIFRLAACIHNIADLLTFHTVPTTFYLSFTWFAARYAFTTFQTG